LLNDGKKQLVHVVVRKKEKETTSVLSKNGVLQNLSGGWVSAAAVVINAVENQTCPRMLLEFVNRLCKDI